MFLLSLRYGRFLSEILFVITMLMLLKSWLFPLFISIWFPADDHSSYILEWVDVMMGLFSVFIYIGFGSIAKHIYHLSVKEAAFLFLCFHLPLFIPKFPFLTYWEALLSDALNLFHSPLSLHTWQLFFLYYFLYSVGRMVHVVEHKHSEPRRKQLKQRI